MRLWETFAGGPNRVYSSCVSNRFLMLHVFYAPHILYTSEPTRMRTVSQDRNITCLIFGK